MRRTFTVILTGSLAIAAASLSACSKTGGDADTNVVGMNASDGSMNDMTVVESATLDQAGSANGSTGNDTETSNSGNAM